MNAQDHANALALAVWRLSEAERHEITAKKHRMAAAAILGAAHLEFTEALELTKEARWGKKDGRGQHFPAPMEEVAS